MRFLKERMFIIYRMLFMADWERETGQDKVVLRSGKVTVTLREITPPTCEGYLSVGVTDQGDTLTAHFRWDGSVSGVVGELEMDGVKLISEKMNLEFVNKAAEMLLYRSLTELRLSPLTRDNS